MPPPPITASVFAPSSTLTHLDPRPYSPAASAVIQEPQVSTLLPSLARREEIIHAELQQLLDAQSSFLLHGRYNPDVPTDNDGSDTSSNVTPTTHSTSMSVARKSRSGGIQPVRQPKPPHLTLHRARERIHSSMLALLALQTSAALELSVQLARTSQRLGQLLRWEQKISGLNQQIKALNTSTSPESLELTELRTEKSAVDNEVRELEARLEQMRARSRWLGSRLGEAENSWEAKGSSWREGLRGVEREVEMWLKRPREITFIPGIEAMDEGDFYGLPPSRRTLEMARLHFTRLEASLGARLKAVEAEEDALATGAEMWEDVVTLVEGFEGALKVQMSASQQVGTRSMENCLQDIRQVIRDLERNAAEAEGKGWNLMVCAIGAELAAFKEGEKVLQGAMGIVRYEKDEPKSEGGDVPVSNGMSEPAAVPESDAAGDPDTVLQESGHVAGADVESGNDEPDSDLLISHEEGE